MTYGSCDIHRIRNVKYAIYLQHHYGENMHNIICYVTDVVLKLKKH